MKMIDIPNDKQINISGRIWHELYPKVNPSPFLYRLHAGIDLQKYGKGVEKFYFTFIAVASENRLNKQENYFNPKTKEAEIAVELSHEKILKATKAETFKLMEKAYLEGIDQIANLPLELEFNTKEFRKDVEAIFSEHKWYESIMEAAI